MTLPHKALRPWPSSSLCNFSETSMPGGRNMTQASGKQGLSAPKPSEHHGQAHPQVFQRIMLTASHAQGFSLQPSLKKPTMPQFSNALTGAVASPGLIMQRKKYRQRCYETSEAPFVGRMLGRSKLSYQVRGSGTLAATTRRY